MIQSEQRASGATLCFKGTVKNVKGKDTQKVHF
jgi:hypothetical protein